MNNPGVITYRSPRIFKGIPLIFFLYGISIFVFCLLGLNIHYIFFLPALLMIFPFLYISKTVTLYIYAVSFSFTIPLFSYRMDLRLDDILFFVMFTVWLMDKALNSKAETPEKIFKKPLLLWLGINAVSVILILPQFGWFFFIRSAVFMVRFAEYILIYFIVTDLIKTHSQKIILLRIILYSSFFVCIYGLYQYYFMGLVDITSTLSPNHAHIGVYISLSFFVLLGFFRITDSFIDKFLIFLTLPMMVYIVFLSSSRMGVISLLFGIFIFLLFSKKFLPAALAVALAVFMIFFGLDYLDSLMRVDESYAGIQNLERDLSTMGRLYIWYGTYEMVTNNPTVLITGVGLAGFKSALLPYTQLIDGASGAHNNFIHILVETGIAGLLIFLFLIYRILKQSLFLSRISNNSDRFLYFGYFCGLAAIVFSCFTQETFSVQESLHNILGYIFLVTAVVFAKSNNVIKPLKNDR
ncbi:O-antigen ligase family protein [candidate division KSB1 bacterium]